jgi:hypothetical protein
MKVERVCEKCETKFKVSSFNHRVRCYTCLPKATHRFEAYMHKPKEKNESNETSKKN